MPDIHRYCGGEAIRFWLIHEFASILRGFVRGVVGIPAHRHQQG
jgi:hypothetical protein